jgi:hypothetical protein
MTCQQIDAFGRLPPEWWEKWEARRERVTERGEPPYQSLKDLFELNVQKLRIKKKIRPFESSERDSLFAMLRSMLSFRPEDHPSAWQVLESEWMVKWALREYERIRSPKHS